jgi:peptidoglycan/LPS O-acetylase OafA/YrhL
VDNVFFLDLFGSKLVTFVSWALVYEMYFYLLCGVWLIVLRRGKNGPPWFSWLALCALFVANSLYFKLTPVLSDWRFVGFFVGIGLAMLKADPRGRKAFESVPRGVWPVSLGVLGLACWLWSQDIVGTLSSKSPALALGYFALFDLFMALLVASLVNAASIKTTPGDQQDPVRVPTGATTAGGGIFVWTPLRCVGAVSYSLFLLHTQWGLPLATTIFGKPTSLAGLALHYGLSLGVSFILAAFLYMHLEKFYFTRR